MNILITSIGQRGYLVDHFRETCPGVQIFGADCFEFAPALQQADKAFKIPRADDPRYGELLLQACLDHQVDGIISINDRELPFLAENRQRFADHGVTVVISSPDVVDICFDKYRTYSHLAAHGIGVPHTYLYTEFERLQQDLDSGVMTFPLISKPRRGSRSKDIHLVRTMQDLKDEIHLLENSSLEEVEKAMFQEYVDSDQYSLHIFNDWDGDPVTVVGMVNLMRHMAGETYHIKTLKDPALIDLGRRMGQAVGHVGPLCSDIHKRGEEYVVLELNPRIGGCYSLSHFAGANFTGKICQLVARESLKTDRVDDFQDGVVMLKQYSVACTTEAAVQAHTLSYMPGE